MVETKERASKFAEIAKDNQQPMLGLEFVTEFQKSNFNAGARYVCNLCESKCDGSTIVPHVIGLKHRLKYMELKKPQMFDHLNKFNSKRKKSEMNANLEDFAHQIEAEVGRGDVKIKVELDNFEDEEELKETMIRHSKALAVKVKELEEGKIETFEDELPVRSMSREPPIKKLRTSEKPASEWRSRPAHDDHYPDRDDGHESRSSRSSGDIRRDMRGDIRGDYRHPHYEEPRRQRYMYPRDPYYSRRYPDDFKASYRDRFDPYRGDDQYERRMIDERRRLDGLMGEGHRLDDPYAERRRVDDIVQRRQFLDELERARVDDILERRKRLQEADVDYMRLQRFKDRENVASSSRPSLSTEEMTRLDRQLARREALTSGTIQSNQETEAQAIQNKLRAYKSSDPQIAAQQEKAAQALKEEADKNPHINIAKVMSSLSTSMIATEDDAAMALQISNALTQALLKYRLQNATKELSTLAQSVTPMLEKKPEDLSIPGLASTTIPGLEGSFTPGLGSVSTADSKVPSFLRTSQHSTQSLSYPAIDGNTSYLHTLVQGSLGSNMATTSYNPQYRSPQQQQCVESSPHQLYSYTGSTQASESLSYSIYSKQEPLTASSALVSTAYGGVMSASAPSTRTTVAGKDRTHTSRVSTTPYVLPSDQHQQKPIMNTSNVDQPQKLLLESIRKQTELLKQKIQASVAINSKSNDSSLKVQSQHQHVPSYTMVATSANPYSSYANSTTVSTSANPYTSYASSTSVATSANPYTSYASSTPVATSANPYTSYASPTPGATSANPYTSYASPTPVATSANPYTSYASSTPGATSANPYTSYANSTTVSTSANPYTSYASSTASQLNSTTGHVTSVTVNPTVSDYSSQYYQHNYHAAPPNAAPQPIVPFYPPLPSEPAPPLPTNDLPPIRRKKHK